MVSIYQLINKVLNSNFTFIYLVLVKMSTDFPGDSRQSDSSDLSTFDSDNLNQAIDAPDAHKRDRFELLSAYLDGEVTALERKQVESWLATDPTVQRLHTRLLNLRYGLQSMPVPVASQPLEQRVEQVFSRIDRRPKLALVWGGVGAAVAAGLIGILANALPGDRPFVPQVAERTQPDTVQATEQPLDTVGPDTLMVALDQPPGGLIVPQKPGAPANELTEDSWLYPDSNQDIR